MQAKISSQLARLRSQFVQQNDRRRDTAPRLRPPLTCARRSAERYFHWHELEGYLHSIEPIQRVRKFGESARQSQLPRVAEPA